MTSARAVAWWTVVGLAGGVAVVGILSIGVFVLPLVVALAAVGVRRPGLRSGAAPGLLLGAAAAPLWLAVVNRSGPGTVCTTTATTRTCAEQYSPWPFLVTALGLLALGVVLLARAARPAGTLAPSSTA